MDCLRIQTRLDRLQHEAFAARRNLQQEVKAFKQAQQDLRDAEEARARAQAVAQLVQQQAHAQIAGVVTSCLHSVFGEDSYRFQIKFVQKRGKTEAQLVFLRGTDGMEITDPINEDSGGVVQLSAFVLRLACLVLAKPRLRRLIVMDEPFAHVSASYRPAVRSMLQQLSKDFGVQFLMVTHEQEYMTGKVIRL